MFLLGKKNEKIIFFCRLIKIWRNFEKFMKKIQYYPSTKDEENDYIKHCQIILTQYRQQIYSLKFYASIFNNKCLSLFWIYSSLNHLESITFDLFITYLMKMISLPRLFFLKISMSDELSNASDIYQSVFKLSMLKYFHISMYNFISPWII